MLNCPFIIRYNKIDFKSKKQRPGSLYKVRVTNVTAKHTCLMSNSAYRDAKQTSHSSKFDLTEVSTAVNFLKIDPHLKAKTEGTEISLIADELCYATQGLIMLEFHCLSLASSVQ